MQRETPKSMLLAGVSPDKGNPMHFECDDDTAMTVSSLSGEVTAIYTPQCVLRRIHEVMHANHSSVGRQRRVYAGVNEEVRNVAEDIRIHTQHWPWQRGKTPETIVGPCLDFIDWEIGRAKGFIAENQPPKAWPIFATITRAVAMKQAIRAGYWDKMLLEAGMADRNQRAFAAQVIELCQFGQEGKAARLMQAAFFPPPPLAPPGKGRGKLRGHAPGKWGSSQPRMQIIELPHTQAIPEASVGYRIATSGSRLYRPALRKPILPQRLFVRRHPVEPGGTILVDASGSMGSWDEVKQWCEKAPHATVAYYAGSGRKGAGWLYVYARNGYRAREIIQPANCGNMVDGPAMTWLMSQEPPRIMITDRYFNGAEDSEAQIIRLAMLERMGEIEVRNYKK